MSDNKVRLLRKDGTLCDINEWYQMAHDCVTHRTLEEYIRYFRANIEWFAKKGLSEEMGYTEETIEKSLCAINRKYAEYVASGGVIG